MKNKLPDVSEIDIEEALEKTLLYSKLFNSGVKINELHSFLLEREVTKEQLEIAIKSLLAKNLISINDGTVILNRSIEHFYKRKNKTLDGRLINNLLKILRKIPFISTIAFSGGTANYGIENHEDIDLFIITKPYTVYIVYFIIHMAALLLKSRKIVCTNYLIDEKEIQIKRQHDLYTAHQIITLVPFKNKSFLNHFLNHNEWVKSHYPNFALPESMRYKNSIIFIIFRPFNLIFKFLYRFRYKKYLSLSNNGEIVLSEHVIKLHTNDYRLKILNEFQNQWEKYTSEKNDVPVLSS
jgi:hypothetical protein